MITLYDIQLAAGRLMTHSLEEIEDLAGRVDLLRDSPPSQEELKATVQNLEKGIERLEACIYRTMQLLNLDPDSFIRQSKAIESYRALLQKIEGIENH